MSNVEPKLKRADFTQLPTLPKREAPTALCYALKKLVMYGRLSDQAIAFNEQRFTRSLATDELGP